MLKKCPPANTIAKDALSRTWMLSDNEVALKAEVLAIMTRGKQKGTASSHHAHEGRCLIAHLLPTMTTASDTATMEISVSVVLLIMTNPFLVGSFKLSV